MSGRIVTGADVREASDICCQFLHAQTARSWDVAVPDLDFTVAGVVSHAAEACLWCAIDLTAAGVKLETVEHRVRADCEPALLVDTLATFARMAAGAIDAAPAGARGFDPDGAGDASGFAAMACDELLIHTDDAARGLGAAFGPDPVLAGRVLARLFPWVEPDPDPWSALRWANGRVHLPGRPRLVDWKWHVVPLDEWDGTPVR